MISAQVTHCDQVTGTIGSMSERNIPEISISEQHDESDDKSERK